MHIPQMGMYIEKTKDGIKPKARLVAQGFEEDNLSEIQKYSPTCSKDTLRAVLSIICQRKWNLQSIDIKTAFLQGDSLKREIFVKPPPEAQCDLSILRGWSRKIIWVAVAA